MPPRRRGPRTTDAGAPLTGPASIVKKECKFYNQGSCRFGEHCKFLHLARIENDNTTQNVQATIAQAGTTRIAEAPQPTPAGIGARRQANPQEPTTAFSNVNGGNGSQAQVRLPPTRTVAPPAQQRATANVVPPPAPPATALQRTPAPTVSTANTNTNTNTSTVAPPYMPPSRRRPKQKKPCFTWQRNHCAQGEACQYRHDGASGAQKRMALELAAREEEARRQEEEDRLRREEEERQERERQEQERIAREREAAEHARQLEAQRLIAARREQERLERLRKEREEREERERRKLEIIKRKDALEQEQRRRREAQVTLQLLVQGSNLVTFGPGFDIKRVIPGFELCKITIRQLPPDASHQETENLFREQGLDDTMFHLVSQKHEHSNDTQIAEFLMRTEEAQVMAVGLEGLEFRDNLLEFEVGANASWGSMTSSNQDSDAHLTLTVLWSKPSATMVATYSTVELARRNAKQLDRKMLGGRRITAAMNSKPNGPAARYWVEASVKVGNLDPDTGADEVQVISGAHTVRPIKSNLYNLDSFLVQLQSSLLRDGCTPESYKSIPLDDIRMKTVAQFPNRDALERAAATLERGLRVVNGFGFGSMTQTGPHLRVIVPTAHQYTISISPTQYRAQKSQWDAMTEGARGQKAFVRVNERRNAQVLINVQGSDQQEIGPLKVRVEGLVAGERLDNEHWHNTFMFARSTKALFDRVMGETGVFVSVDRRMHVLRLFGKSTDITAAKDIIREDVERLHLMQWDVPIARQSVRFFVATGLQILKDALGEENVTLDVAGTGGCNIKLRGGDDAIQHARKLIEEAVAASNLGLPPPQEEEEGGALCPICYDTAAHPEVLSCGHSCCEPCLRHYLTSAAGSDKFPLVCMGDEATCNTPISIPIIERYLTKPRFNRLVDSVFSSHIQSNPRKFKYCTTPDCTQIYQCDTDQQFHQCPSCFSKICSSCNEEAHQGMTCEERRIQSNPEEQERLTEAWAQDNNIKRCPSCNILTEKTEGCNHMTCSQCNGHWCWLCRGVFTAGTVYNHMNTVHGGIYGADIVQPQLPQVPQAAPQRIIGEAPARVPHIIAWEEHFQAERAFERQQQQQQQRVREEQRVREVQRERDARLERERETVRLFWRRQEEQQRQRERLAAEVARREAEEKKKGGFCAIM